jgi:subtilisin
MRRVIFTAASLLVIAALVLMVGGCSQDMSTSPDSTAITSQKLVETQDFKKVLIAYRGDMPRTALEAAGAQIQKSYGLFPIVVAMVPEKAIFGLRNNPNILAVEEDIPREICAQTLDWGVDRIDAEYVHATSGNRGAGVNVAVLDTGGDMDHPDLTWAGGISMVNRDPEIWEDKNGHGTHCSGIVSADDNDIGVVGVAPECNLYMVQLSKSGRLSLYDIVDGINWCAETHHDMDPDNDIQIMSMSFSGGYSVNEEVAIQAAYDEGILLVAASGNDASSVRYPAALAEVMAISGSNSSDGMYYYSNTGPEIELIAPGQAIYSTYKWGEYRTLTGTSMACPMVVGTAALIWSDNPSWTRDQVRSRLHETAEDIGFTPEQQGYGLVDAENATLGTTNGDD